MPWCWGRDGYGPVWSKGLHRRDVTKQRMRSVFPSTRSISRTGYTLQDNDCEILLLNPANILILNKQHPTLPDTRLAIIDELPQPEKMIDQSKDIDLNSFKRQ